MHIKILKRSITLLLLWTNLIWWDGLFNFSLPSERLRSWFDCQLKTKWPTFRISQTAHAVTLLFLGGGVTALQRNIGLNMLKLGINTKNTRRKQLSFCHIGTCIGSINSPRCRRFLSSVATRKTASSWQLRSCCNICILTSAAGAAFSGAVTA